jgi:dipeptidyl aminopeptidase/acylaminoacyl peptidase
MLRALIFLCLLMLASAPTTAQTQRLTPELLWKIGRVGLECVSPDGQQAVYGVQRFDMAANSGQRALYLVRVSDGDTQALTDGKHVDSDAEFHPDGTRVGFLRNGHLHEVGLSGTDTPRQVSDLDMNGFHYAPDGSMILFTRDVKLDLTPPELYPDAPKTLARVSDGLMYRHWKSWHDYAYSHVFVAALSSGSIGTPKDLMDGEKYDSPLRPMGGMEQVQWSPDGRFVAYTCRKLSGTAEAQSTNSDIFVYEIKSGRTLNFSTDLPGYDLDPIWSPDGHYLAWTSLERPGHEADRPRLMLLDVYSQQRRELTKGWAWECNHPQWGRDSKSLYFLSSQDFTYQINQIQVEDGKIRRITEGRHDYTALRVAANGQLVATRVAMDAPAEVFAVDAKTGRARPLSKVTADVWGQVSKSSVARSSVTTTDGKDMNVWVVTPPDFDINKKYPAVVVCQGGPQSAMSQGFSYRWNYQLMAAQGYVVIAPCRRGMPGGPEGQAWNDAISGDWGGQAMQDLLSATDFARRQPWIDANRVGAVGASFGGYSVYWLAGHHEGRFKAFISHCGMFNTTSWWGTTEELWFAKHDLGADYWSQPNDPAWAAFSPHRFVDKWDTPMLVIHNELDFRVPFGEGMQAFQAAQLRGIPSRFLSFPDEGHWMSKPQNSLVWQREFFGWLDRWLKP